MNVSVCISWLLPLPAKSDYNFPLANISSCRHYYPVHLVSLQPSSKWLTDGDLSSSSTSQAKPAASLTQRAHNRTQLKQPVEQFAGLRSMLQRLGLNPGYLALKASASSLEPWGYFPPSVHPRDSREYGRRRKTSVLLIFKVDVILKK